MLVLLKPIMLRQVYCKEAAGEDLAFSVTLMHGQDHLMTTLLLKDMMSHMIELYKRGDK